MRMTLLMLAKVSGSWFPEVPGRNAAPGALKWRVCGMTPIIAEGREAHCLNFPAETRYRRGHPGEPPSRPPPITAGDHEGSTLRKPEEVSTLVPRQALRAHVDVHAD